jgi:hypothetical protein
MSREDPTSLGIVRDVTGQTVAVEINSDALSGLTFIHGQVYRIAQVGGFVRISMGYVDLYGVISQVGSSAMPKRDELVATSQQWMTVQLAGQARRDGRFERGIGQYPTVGVPVHTVTDQDLLRIYGHAADDQFVRIGHLSAAPAIPALLDINKLVTRHSAVVGSTGSGKSTTVASLVNALTTPDRYPSARILVIDIHGEYATALRDRANIFRVGANQRLHEQELHIPYWALTFDELVELAFGSVEEGGRGPLAERILSLKRQSLQRAPRPGLTEDLVTVDSPVPFSLHDLWFDLHTEMRANHYERADTPQSRHTWALELDAAQNPVQPGDPWRVIPPRFRPLKNEKGDPEKIRLSHSNLNLGNVVDRLASRLRDPRLDFLFRPGSWTVRMPTDPTADLDSLLELWIGSPYPVSIIDLSGVPHTIQSYVVGALLRVLFDSLFWARNFSEGGRFRPLLAVLEEAHTYLQAKADNPASNAVQKIAKEGRKYGLGLMVVSQRPSEVDPTILSQCGTLISLRLSNPSDRQHITSAAADNLEGLMSMLSTLRVGEAIVVGEAVNLPLRAQVTPPPANRRPDSADPTLVTKFYSDGTPEDNHGWNLSRPVQNYTEVVAAWRRQDPYRFTASAGIPEEARLREWEHVMNMVVVDSTSIDAIGYDQATSTLYVRLKRDNQTYQYFEVPAIVHTRFMESDSKGVYFNAEIRPKYRNQRM